MKEVSRRTYKRVLALALVFTMLLGMPGLTVLAAQDDPAPAADRDQPELRLWYDEPAYHTTTPGDNGSWATGGTPAKNSQGDVWQQYTLPIGNGTIGATVYGEIGTERLLLNEQTLWSGGPSESRQGYIGGNIESRGRDGAAMREIQELFKAGDVSSAREKRSNLTGEGNGNPGYGYFLPWGELHIATAGLTDSTAVTDYQRWLSLDDALAGVRFTVNGTTYTREYLTSYPDNVLAARLTSTGGSMDLTITLPGRSVSTGENNTKVQGNDTLALCGAMSDNQLKFASYVKAVPVTGTVTAGSDGKSLVVTGSTEVILYFTAATDYKQIYPHYRTGETDEELAGRVMEKLNAAVAKGYDSVRTGHLSDYHSLYNRMNLDLGQEATTKPTDDLLNAYNAGTASESERRLLEVTLFQYGRYLTIASSREGSQLPSNLQGIWNYHDTPGWHSDFHTNVNLQMNYWPTYVTNLAECADPVIRYIDSLREPGRVTARIYAGIVSDEDHPENGFMAHTQNTPYGWTCPGASFDWGWAPSAIPWMLQNCWEHYEYNGDLEYMKREIYPMMKEYARTYEQLLVDVSDYELGYEPVCEAGSAPYYASVPAYSPETGPATVGNTFEHSLIWQLFEDTITAAELLGVDSDRVGYEETPGTWKYFQAHLIGPIVVGESGQIKEWYDETGLNAQGKPLTSGGSLLGSDTKSVPEGFGHRHISHMLGLFPGDLVQKNQEWIDAAFVSMNNRTFTSTGWGMGHRINVWARLREKENAYQLICNLFANGMYVNLWDAHAPFQIDGNFGYTSGVAEMLMQSNMGFIDLLPALPAAWADGSFRGMVARGNFQLNASWADSALTDVEILSKNGGECVVAYPQLAYAKVTDASGNAIPVTALSNDKVSFQTAKGQTYRITEIPRANVKSVSGAAYRTGGDTVELRWDAASGKTYTVYRQVEDGEVMKLDSGLSTSPYVDETAYEALGQITYYIAEGDAASEIPITSQDVRNMDMLDDRDSRIVYSGGWGNWSEDVNYAGTIKYLENPTGTETVTLTFYGTGIKVFSCKNHDRGKLEISIDGEVIGEADTYNSSTVRQAVVFTKDDLDPGIHTITVRATNTKNSSSSKTKVEIDAFQVLGGQTTVDPGDTTLEISTVGGVEKLWSAGDTVQFTANLEGVTWSMTSTHTHASTCGPNNWNTVDHYHVASISTSGLLTAGKTAETVTVTATVGSQTASKTITISPNPTMTIIEDAVGSSPNTASGKITWGGNWSVWDKETTKHHGGNKTENNGNSTSDYVEITFNGTGIAVYGTQHFNNGAAAVVLDDVARDDVSFYGTGDKAQVKLAEYMDLADGQHTLRLTAKTLNGKTHLVFDFFEIYSTNSAAPTVDLTALKNAVAGCAELRQVSYTEDSWRALETALADATALLNGSNPGATEADVTNAVNAIATAKANLTPRGLTAPENVQAILTEGTAVTLKWNEVDAAESYEIRVARSGVTERTITDVTTNIRRIDGLNSGAMYTFTVSAKLGNQSQAALPLEVETLDTEAPTMPKNLDYSGGELSWTASRDNKGVTGYKVLLSGVEQADKTTATTRNLTIADGEIVQVVAFDAAGNESAPAFLLVAPEYSVTVTGGTISKNLFKAGEAVCVSATIDAGHVFKNWTATGVTLGANADNADLSFPMPAGNVVLTANTEEKLWPVELDLTDLTSTEVDDVAHHGSLTLTLTAPAPKKLPSAIHVTMGGEELRATHYLYNADTGSFTLTDVTGAVVITAVAQDQAPQGSAFSASDPFQLPGSAGTTVKAEAEYMSPTGATVANGPGFGNKHLGTFTSGNKIGLYYNAPVAGIYTATLRYRSARAADRLHTFGWTGAKVVAYSNAAIQNTLNDSGVGVYATVERDFEVTEAGTGLVEFTVGNVGDTTFNLDWISFKLESMAGPAATSVTLSPATKTIYTNQGQNVTTLTAEIEPVDASRQLRWTSSDEEIATVDQGGNVTAFKNGVVTITAAARNGVTGTATITVKTKVSGSVSVTGMPKYGETLTAAVNQLTPAAARDYLEYQWFVDGAPILGETGETYQTGEDDIGKQVTVAVRVTGLYEGSENGVTAAPVTVLQADGPAVGETVTAEDCTNDEDTNGKITGLDPDLTYVYKKSDGAWITSEAAEGRTEIDSLTPGTYQIYVKGSATHTDGPVSELTILGHNTVAYNVTIGRLSSGTISAAPNRTADGETVTLTVTPTAGYRLVDGSLTVTDGDDNEISLTDGGNRTYTFVMPASDVTVTAEFEEIVYTLAHRLTNISCTMGEGDHTVHYGDKPEIILTPDDGYELPDTVTITKENGDTFEGYTYSGGVITFIQPITESLTVTGTGVQKQYRVNYRLTGVSAIGQPRGVNHDQALHIILTADDQWELPAQEDIIITINGRDYADFTYADGVIDIAAGVIDGNVEITAEGQASGPLVTGVTIVGQAVQGRELAVRVTPTQAVVRYQWLWVNEDGAETSIPGATKPRYTLSTEDVGKILRVRATGVSPYIGVETSADFGPVAEAAVVAVTGVTLNKTSITLLGGSSTALVATVLPENATNKTVRWSTGDADVAEVDEYGVVRGLAAGTTTITATTVNGEKTATCAVEVIDIILEPTSASVRVGETTSLHVSVSSLLSSQAVTWTSSDEEVATVDRQGVVTGVAAGTATITVKTVVGNLSAQCVVRVGTSGSSGGGGGGYVPPKTETREDGATVTTVTKPDGSQVETVEQPDGAKTETVTARNGEVTVTVTDPEGEVIVKVEIPAVLPTRNVPFTDVPKDHWANKAVETVAGLGLVKGVGGNLFDMEAPMTRGSLATILHRLSQGKTDCEVTFKDVSQGKYYTEGVAWAAQVGVVKGMTEEIFAPGQVITREQLAVMLCRYAKLIGMDTTADAKTLEAFPDKAKVGAWAADGMAWCVENGILKGKGQKGLDPAADVTRVEVAVMLERFIELMR